MIKDPCGTCNGQGKTEEKTSLTINIHRGVSTGDAYRIPGSGEAGPPGGENGDLYVLFEIEDHKRFKREQSHLYLEWPVTFPQAALGCKINVPTLGDEPARLRIPAGSQSHQLFSLRGKGMPEEGGGFGDLFVRILVQVPKKMNEEQKDLVKQLDQLLTPSESDSAEDHEKSFFERFRESFRETFHHD